MRRRDGRRGHGVRACAAGLESRHARGLNEQETGKRAEWQKEKNCREG
jgi:hypothetical protein